MIALNQFFAGVLTLGFAVAGLFFFRFFARTRDRLFLMFGIAFVVMSVNRILLWATGKTDETQTELYVVRLVAFAIILVAILDKNLAPRREKRRAARALRGSRSRAHGALKSRSG